MILTCCIYINTDILLDGRPAHKYLLLAECEVRTATYGPEIEQSKHAKSVSHIIRLGIFTSRQYFGQSLGEPNKSSSSKNTQTILAAQPLSI